MAQKSKYPIQFKINDNEPTETVYLKECTCEELIKIAKSKLSNEQLTNYTFTIQDNEDIAFGSDDDELELAFNDVNGSDIETDDENIQALSLNILLKPKDISLDFYISCSVLFNT